jgi:hypothetical protein
MRQFSRGPSGRQWALVWGAVAAACGSSSDLGGFVPSPSAVGGGLQTGGRGAFGGVGGHPAAGGAIPIATGGAMTSCMVGNACWTPNSYCSEGDIACQCINGAWGMCAVVTTGGTASIWTGGKGPTGGSPSGGRSAVGGSYSGGRAAGGSPWGGTATGGGAAIPVCETVSTLPAMGTACATVGQSQCLANGDRCLCSRGVWYCNTSCAPTPPTLDSACSRGAACTYSSGEACACINLRWMCVGASGCPANLPMTGLDCTGSTGIACDYPNANPALHMACACTGGFDAGVASTWTCIQSAACPATQPPYSLSATCPGTAICSYGNTHCACLATGAPWICLSLPESGA